MCIINKQKEKIVCQPSNKCISKPHGGDHAFNPSTARGRGRLISVSSKTVIILSEVSSKENKKHPGLMVIKKIGNKCQWGCGSKISHCWLKSKLVQHCGSQYAGFSDKQISKQKTNPETQVLLVTQLSHSWVPESVYQGALHSSVSEALSRQLRSGPRQGVHLQRSGGRNVIESQGSLLEQRSYVGNREIATVGPASDQAS